MAETRTRKDWNEFSGGELCHSWMDDWDYDDWAPVCVEVYERASCEPLYNRGQQPSDG